MRSFSTGPSWKFAAAAFVAALLAACGHGRSKPDTANRADSPAGFDVTLVADKDTQFDYDGAPLTAEDLKSALRYRQEESLPMSTVLLKRGEKEKVKNEHLIALARMAYQMKFKAYVQEKDGSVSELRAEVKDANAAQPNPPGEGKQ
jgi:predicted RecB family endonuclease